MSYIGLTAASARQIEKMRDDLEEARWAEISGNTDELKVLLASASKQTQEIIKQLQQADLEMREKLITFNNG